MPPLLVTAACHEVLRCRSGDEIYATPLIANCFVKHGDVPKERALNG